MPAQSQWRSDQVAAGHCAVPPTVRDYVGPFAAVRWRFGVLIPDRQDSWRNGSSGSGAKYNMHREIAESVRERIEMAQNAGKGGEGPQAPRNQLHRGV